MTVYGARVSKGRKTVCAKVLRQEMLECVTSSKEASEQGAECGEEGCC